MRFASLFVFATACGSPSRPPVVANQGPAPSPTTPAPVASSRGLEFRVVDEDSAFMNRVFVRVGHDKSGLASDPLALSSGVGVDTDLWPDPAHANVLRRDYYLTAKDRKPIQQYVTQLSSDPAFEVPKDRELAFEQLDHPDHAERKWRSYLVERTPSLDGSMVSSAISSFDPNTSKPLVLLEFDARGAQRLAELTKRIVGKKLAIVFNGRVRSAPIINGEIAGGHASIAMGGNDVDQMQRDADELTRALNSK